MSSTAIFANDVWTIDDSSRGVTQALLRAYDTIVIIDDGQIPSQARFATDSLTVFDLVSQINGVRRIANDSFSVTDLVIGRIFDQIDSMGWIGIKTSTEYSRGLLFQNQEFEYELFNPYAVLDHHVLYIDTQPKKNLERDALELQNDILFSKS